MKIIAQTFVLFLATAFPSFILSTSETLCETCECDEDRISCEGDMSWVTKKMQELSSVSGVRILAFQDTSNLGLSWMTCSRLQRVSVLEFRNAEVNCSEVIERLAACWTSVNVFCSEQTTTEIPLNSSQPTTWNPPRKRPPVKIVPTRPPTTTTTSDHPGGNLTENSTESNMTDIPSIYLSISSSSEPTVRILGLNPRDSLILIVCVSAVSAALICFFPLLCCFVKCFRCWKTWSYQRMQEEPSVQYQLPDLTPAHLNEASGPSPSASGVDEDNVFDMAEMKAALPHVTMCVGKKLV